MQTTVVENSVFRKPLEGIGPEAKEKTGGIIMWNAKKKKTNRRITRQVQLWH